MRRVIVGSLVAGVFSACGGDGDGGEGEATTSTLCRRWASLSEARGCTAPTSGCDPLPTCSAQYEAWFDCLEADLGGGCICEGTDGDLNCEGSWKPDEGTARCIDEVDAMNACDTR